MQPAPGAGKHTLSVGFGFASSWFVMLLSSVRWKTLQHHCVFVFVFSLLRSLKGCPNQAVQTKNQSWLVLHNFVSRFSLTQVTWFPARDTCYMLPHAWHSLDIFPCLTLHVTCFPALDTGKRGYMFSRVRHRLHVFPRLAQVSEVTFFPAFNTGCMFSRAWHRLHVFPRLAQVTCFPAFDTGYLFSRIRHRLHVFPRSTQVTCFPRLAQVSEVTCFPALATGDMFLLRILIGLLRYLWQILLLLSFVFPLVSVSRRVIRKDAQCPIYIFNMSFNFISVFICLQTFNAARASFLLEKEKRELIDQLKLVHGIYWIWCYIKYIF